MKSGLQRMIRAASDHVPLIRSGSRNARAPFRADRTVIRDRDRARRAGWVAR
jgi:hypothetical protein